MSPRRRAQLLLPTPLGTVEYDVLEEAAFVGPAKRGGLTADPMPFPEATAAITGGPDGYVIRALPGEADPLVNGEPGGGKTLVDGDRIGLGDQEIGFRTDRPSPRPAAVPAAADPEPAPSTRPAGGEGARRRGRGRRTGPRMRPNPYVTAVTLVGLLLLLFGLFLVLEQLGSLREDERVTVVIPDPPRTPERLTARADAAREAYDEAVIWQEQHGEDCDGVVARYHDVMTRYPESPQADRARARIREIVDEAARQALARLDAQCKAVVKEGHFNNALKAIRQFERRYGATSSADEVEPIRRRVREAARRSLDKLLADVGPIVAKNPRAAHRQLLLFGPDYPPDLAAEITGLMELAIDLMKTQGRPPPERRKPPAVPVEPGMHPRDTPQPPEEGGDEKDETIVREAEARNAWKHAYDALKAGKYQESLEGYTLLSLRYGGTDVFRDNRRAIVNGRFAAKAGAQGPAGLLSVPVEEKRGRITVEYTFDDARVFQNDFTTEQPFPSERPVSVKVDRGSVLMKDSSGLFHALVWSSDVRLEARVVAEVAHDFGVLAVAETDEYRAVLLNVNNTRFTLKKGAAAKPNPGHLLWFMGQGVWADADPDYIGYIKIAERQKTSIENGDRVNLELIRRGDQCEGGFQGRTDGVSLKGQVKGDDGKGMAAARIGLFTNTGALVVESIKITGKVDEAWFAQHVADLVELAQGPEE